MSAAASFLSHFVTVPDVYPISVTVSRTNFLDMFSIFKRGMKGIYWHCAEKHLHRSLAEFDVRSINRTKIGINDVTRRDSALKGIEGKRVTNRRIGGAALT